MNLNTSKYSRRGAYFFSALLILTTFSFAFHVPNVGSLIKSAEAASTFSVQTGYYLGSGSQRTITGLGFDPELVIIKADTAAGSMLWKSSAMASNVTAYLGVATADNTENMVTLGDDGFTVSASLEVNTTGVTYTFIAFAGSDCTAGGAMCIGSYTGDANTTQSVNTGFAPDLVWVKRSTALAGTFRTSLMSDNHSALFSATVDNIAGSYFTTLDSAGFSVGVTNNTNSGLYYYVAFKNTTGLSYVGEFTGNGVDNRNITGVGFEPDFVLVKQNSAIVPAFNTTEMYGDYSSVSTAAASAANHIQELQADGFQVGNSTSVNANGIASHYFAFGGSPDPTPSGSFLMERGSYQGTGVAQTIETSFEPNLVIIKGNVAYGAVWSTSLHGDATEYFGIAAAAFTGGVNIMSGQNGFSLGTHVSVNNSGIEYEYVAFGNATSPRKGDGAADFYIGSYTGNSIDNRAIDHLGFSPSMVVIKRSNGTANQSVWKSDAPTMADDTAAYFSATANNTAGALVRTLTDDGFTVGNNLAVNTAGATYVWFAFAEGANFDIGTYSGNSSVDTEITGVGFSPDFVWTKRDTASAAVMRSSSPTLVDGTSQHMAALANDTNDIKSLTADGFVLGNSAEVNTTGGSYQYAAWNSSLSMAIPNTPTNSTPANNSTGQNLNLVLNGSSYSDTDGSTHTDTQWQIDDDSNFATPVWTRTAGSGEASTTVNGSNGTFANELSGKSELDHTAVYYWRVRYSDGSYSAWSTATSFTTNEIVTPTNVSPEEGESVLTKTPVLTSSAFSDPQTGHTASSSQWQISVNNDFSSPLYDSDTVSYGLNHAVPGATLSDRNSYHWRVRHQDSSGFWSAWSTATKFGVDESEVTVLPLFGNTTVGPTDQINIDVQVKRVDGSLLNDADVDLNIYNSAGTKLVDAGSMTYISGSKAVYRYSYTLGTTTGSYMYEVTASTTDSVGYGAANFQVVAGTDLSSLESMSEDILTNVEMLISGLVVIQSTVQDSSASETAFVTGLSNTIDDFYTHGTIVFTSGDLDGLVRRISDYDGTTKTITIDPPAPIVPADGTSFTITSQNLRSQDQLATVTSQLSDIEAKVDIISGNVDLALTNLSTIQNSLSTVQTSLNSIRASQQEYFNVELSDADVVSTTGEYRATLTIRDFESNPIAASSAPLITIYDPERVEKVTAAEMTADSTGVYSYTYVIPDNPTGGTWESRVVVDPDGDGDLVLSDIWSLSGSAAEVSINQISDITVPSIMAQTTITNEGGMDQEYNYTWCVVATESNACGGDDDVYSSSAAKLLVADESYASSLAATVETPGVYWFKLLVNYDSGVSGASLQFTASEEGEEVSTETSSAGGVKEKVSVSTLSRDIQSLRTLIEADSAKLTRTIDLIGNIDPASPGFRSLLSMAGDTFDSVNGVQNKVTEVRALSDTVRQIIEGGASVKVSPFLEWGSVKFGFLISNPTTVEQTIEFKSFLPEEVKPEHIKNLDGFKLDFDTAAGMYYVHDSITLGPQDSIVRKVHVDDIWRFDESELESRKHEAREMLALLRDSQYEVPATLLVNEIENAIDAIVLRQNETLEPQVHILNYRENKLRLERVLEAETKLKDLVVDNDASKGIFGRLSGIEIASTWILIAAVILGFLFLSIFLMMMWRHQMRFAEKMLASRDRGREVHRAIPAPSSVKREVVNKKAVNQVGKTHEHNTPGAI